MRLGQRGAARYLVGRKIVAVDMRPFNPNRPGEPNAVCYDPAIRLDDGTEIRFVVEETETGKYGIAIVRSSKSTSRRKAGT